MSNFGLYIGPSMGCCQNLPLSTLQLDRTPIGTSSKRGLENGMKSVGFMFKTLKKLQKSGL